MSSSPPPTTEVNAGDLHHNRPQIHNTRQILGVTLDPTDLILYFLLVFVPPLAVLLRKDFRSREFLISLVVWFLFHFPGTLYAFYIIYDTSIVTGSDTGIGSRVHWSGSHLGYENLIDEDVEAQTNLEQADLPEQGIYHDDGTEDHPPTYEESSSSLSPEAAARVESKTFNDNKIQK